MAKEKELSFEENLNNLETIVKDLESGNIPLDDAINKFTEAMKIAKTCDEKLKNAEENVNKILNKDGTLSDFNIEEE
jgi:exodeoxyribonuclease VII small subunit